MNKYSTAAIKAVNFLNNHKAVSPEIAWEMATQELFRKGSPAQEKGCPKCAFLGLCEDGYIVGVPIGKYLRKQNSVNKDYAIQALNRIKAEPPGEFTPIKLWKRVVEGSGKHHDYQMDVVLALWESGRLSNI